MNYIKRKKMKYSVLRKINLISSLIPLFAKKVFMEFQDVSCTPISLSTPSRMSRMTSGGARNDLKG